MRFHRRFAPIAALAVVASLISVAGSARADVTCAPGEFCAGAAGADITPPVTTPMWGYTARQGVLASGNVPTDVANGVTALGSGDVAGFVAGLQSAKDEQFVHDKLNPSADRYDKTFVSNHGIHLRLFANAFVLRGADGGKVAIVQTDLGGLPGEVHQAVADRLVQAGIGVDRDHLMITATHTHQGPGGFFQYSGYALLGGDLFDPRVFDAVVTGITNAVERANASLSAARMAWGQISTTGANRNRRVAPQWCEDPENKCEAAGGSLFPTPASPPANDPLLTVMRVDRADGLPIGVVTNFAAHGTIGGDDNLLFSGDNQGWATRLIEGAIEKEANVPSGWHVVDALINGAQGDQSPIGSNDGYDWGGTQREYSEMENAGMRQAAPAIAEWRALGDHMRSDWTVDSRFESLCFCGQEVNAPFVYDGDKIDKADPFYKHISPYAMLGNPGTVGSDGQTTPVAYPAQGHKYPALGGAGTNPSITRVQVLRIGDLLWAGVPGEPTVTAGRRIKDALRSVPNHDALYGDVVVAGLANDYDSYYATPEEYTAAQYEGSFTLFGPQSVPLLEQEFYGLADMMVRGQAVPACPGPDAFCVDHMPHPDTSALATPPAPIGIDPTPRALAEPAQNVARFEVAEFGWQGGSPSAEWRLDQDRVELQRADGAGWTTVAGDARDAATVLRYDDVDGQNRWTAQWDIPRDAAPGTYRFHIIGAYGAGAGQRAPYTLDSTPFSVTPSTGLSPDVRRDGSTLTICVRYPQPDKARSFRWRAPCATDGTVTVSYSDASGDHTARADVDPSGITQVDLGSADAVITGVTATDTFGNDG